jgi:phospholipid/cholesterol/gamma-HCH transport system substrate-binding protein
MENKAHAMAAGTFVVVLAVVLLLLAAWLTRDHGPRDIYEISTKEAVTGLQAQAPVRYKGVDVGKVSRIGFDPKAPSHVLLRLEVDEDLVVTRNTWAELSYQGVTGLAFIQLLDNGKPAARLSPNDEVPPRIPLQPGLVAKLQERGEVILDQVEQVSVRLNKLLNDENQKRVASALANLDDAAGSAKQLAQRLDNTAAKHLDPALDQAKVTLRSLDKSANEVTRAATDFGETARRLNAKDGPIDRVSEGTAALSHAADAFNTATLPRINRVTEDASRAVRQLGRTMANINDNPQSLIYGTGAPQPGPGEPGFQAPGGAR